MTRGATALVALASVLLLAATLVGYARLALFNSDQFANRASAALASPAVRAAIGERVTDEVVLRNDADLIAARPLIASAVSGIVGGGAFRSLFRRGVLDAHRAIFAGDRDTLTLTLADVGTVVAAALEKLDPRLADELDAGERVVLLKRDLGNVTAGAVRTGKRLRVLAWLLAALTLAAAAAALVVSRDRRRTVAQLGVGVAAAGLTIVIGYTVARALLVDGAAAGVWDAYLGDLRAFGWVLAGSGAVVAAAAASLIAPVEVEAPLRAAWRIATTEPPTTALRLIRAASLVAAGILLIARPLAMLQVAVTLVGVYVLYKGVEIVLRMVYRPRPAPAEGVPAPTRPRRARRLAVPVLAALVVAVAVVAFAAGGGTEAPAQPVTACNGSAKLCGGRSTRSFCPRRTTRCRCRCRAGTRPSRSARSAPSSRTASAASCSTPTTGTGSAAGGFARTSAAASSAMTRRRRTGSAPRRSSRRCGCATGSGSAARARAGCTCATASASSAPPGSPTASRTSTTSW